MGGWAPTPPTTTPPPPPAPAPPPPPRATFAQPVVLAIVGHSFTGEAGSGPLPGDLLQHSPFYDIVSYPAVATNERVRVGFCASLTATGVPSGATSQLRVAKATHEIPARLLVLAPADVSGLTACSTEQIAVGGVLPESAEPFSVFGVVASPVAHSMSPAVHNAAFERTGYDGVYLPMPIPPEYEHFKATVGSLIDHPQLDFRGAAVTLPHKENLLRFVLERGGRADTG
jgi:hypothetical protein